MEPHAAGVLALVVILVLFVLLKLKGSGGSGASAGGKAGKGSSKTVVDVEAEADSKPVVRILYGTQTGTAERFSKALGAELRRKYGESTTVDVLDVENYKKPDARLPKERLVLFLMATYGDGEPTDNAADFYSWITSEAEAVENGEKEAYMQVRPEWAGAGQRAASAAGRQPWAARSRCSGAATRRRSGGAACTCVPVPGQPRLERSLVTGGET